MNSRWQSEKTLDFSFGSVAQEESGDRLTLIWWAGLCAVSLLNVVLWLVARRAELPDTDYRAWQLALSGIYVAACAFRSFFPRVDLERLCLWDTRLSAIFTGRSVATLAEICFAVQCSLALAKLGEITGVGYLEPLSAAIVPLIVTAQILCWYGVLSLNHLGHVVEELLWALGVVLLAVGLAACWPYTDGVLSVVTAIGIVCCTATALLISFVDVPMYISRWRLRQRAEPNYLSLVSGLADAVARRHSTRNWAFWRREVPWMTLYFSVGVWLSIGMTLLDALAR